MAMPAFTAWPGLAKRTGAPLIMHVAGVGRMHAGHDLDQGRFAGAVLAQQRMHFARPHIETHILQHADADEGFGDARECDERRHG